MRQWLRWQWLRWGLLLLAVVSLFFWLQTINNLVGYARSTHAVDAEITSLCPRGEQTYELEVEVTNGSRHVLTLEGFIFELHHGEQLIASTVLLEPATLEPEERYVQQLVLTSTLAPENLPPLDSCGVKGQWRAAGRIRGQFPIAREVAVFRAKAGGQ